MSDGAFARVAAIARRIPFTLTVVVVMLVVAVAAGTLWSPANEKPWFDQIAYGLPSFEAGRWYTVVTGVFVALVPLQYLPVAGGFLLLVGFAETRLGTARTALVTVAAQVAGVLGAALFLHLVSGHGWLWADRTAEVLDVGFSAGAMGAAAAASAGLRVPWRGRLRFLLVAYCLVSVLYVGALWDVEHLIAVALGLAVGPALSGRRWSVHRARLGRREWRLLAAAWTAFVSLAVLLSSVVPGAGPLADAAAETGTDSGGGPGLLIAAVLLLLADGLRRGRRVAWRWVLGFSLLAVLAAVFPPYTPDSVYTGLLLAGLVVVLVVGRRRAHAFAVRGDRRSGRRVLLVVGVAFAVLALYAFVGFALLGDQIRPSPDFDSASSEFVSRLLLGTSGTMTPTTTAAHAFLVSLSLLWVLVLVGSLVLVLWNNRRPPVSDHDEVVALIRRHGGSNLSWMSTWPDNAHWFTDDRDACMAYRVHAGAAIGLGDPVCAAGREAEVLAGFAAYAEENGLVACAFSTTEGAADIATGLGWRSLQVAEEAVVSLPDLEFKGKSWQDIRTAINRAKKEGVAFAFGRLDEQSRRHISEVRAISEQWVAEKGLPEMGFTLGGVEEALDPEVRVGLAVNADGGVDGVTSWLPVYGPGGVVRGWTLDVMRRRDGGFRPVTEFLIASSAMAFKEGGALFVSLSGAPLAHSGDDVEEGPLDRLLDLLGEQLEPYYGFRSLHQFKAKFKPTYAPMFLVYPDEAALPRVGVAIGRAYLPDAGLAELAALVRGGEHG